MPKAGGLRWRRQNFQRPPTRRPAAFVASENARNPVELLVAQAPAAYARLRLISVQHMSHEDFKHLNGRMPGFVRRVEERQRALELVDGAAIAELGVLASEGGRQRFRKSASTTRHRTRPRKYLHLRTNVDGSSFRVSPHVPIEEK